MMSISLMTTQLCRPAPSGSEICLDDELRRVAAEVVLAHTYFKSYGKLTLDRRLFGDHDETTGFGDDLTTLVMCRIFPGRAPLT